MNASTSLDFSDFLSTDPFRKQRFVEGLGSSFEHSGFATVGNLGLPLELMEKLDRLTQSFFSLPEVVKRKYIVEGAGGERGFTPLSQSEIAVGAARPDLKEFFSLGCPRDEADALTQKYLPNVCPTELPRACDVLLRSYKHFSLIAKYLFRAIALYLSLDEHYFDEVLRNGDSLLRLIHYPPVTQFTPGSLRSAAHEDIAALTLLWGAKAPGLEVKAPSGEWSSMTAESGQLVINVGDSLQRLTNGRLKSTTHRVVNPSPDAVHTTRFSVPFFTHFRKDFVIDALSSCVDELHPKQWQPITADAYLHARLVDLGLFSHEDFVAKFNGKWLDELPLSHKT